MSGSRTFDASHDRLDGDGRLLEPVLQDEIVTIYHGDCFDILPLLPDGSVQAVVTDPPYGLGFMGRDWDNPWTVARTGFAGRNDLRLPRYGDQRNATCRTCGGRQRGSRRCRCLGPDWDRLPVASSAAYQRWCGQWAQECLRLLTPGGHLVAFGGTRMWHRLAAGLEDAGFEIRDSIAWLYGSGFPKSLDVARATGTTGGRWRGWGTGLKPAFEPVIIARKPLAGTVAATVQRFSTGALHVDACRVPSTARPLRIGNGRDTPGKATYGKSGPGGGSHAVGLTDRGRWPPNVMLMHAADCSDHCVDGCSVATLDALSGPLRSGANPARRHADVFRDCYGRFTGSSTCRPVRGADSGGASRFFPAFRWQAKASRAERPRVDGRAHPTVKPLDLVRWLVRLVTPDGGLVLDPFLGSGTTAEAARLEGFRCIGIEREAEYLPLILARLEGERA